MRGRGRRRFLGLLTAAATAGGGAEAQAPPHVSMDETGAGRRALAAALRALNEAAGLGVTSDEQERAEAYATGAILEAEAKLRPLVLEDDIDLPVEFVARRRP